MTTTINADTIVGGAVVTADASGVLGLQAAGNTGLTLNSSRAIGVGASPSYGTSGQVLTSAGSSAAPSWTTPATGAMTLITTTTASSSANVLFTGLSSTYKTYMVIVDNAVPATNSVEFRAQLSTNGGTSYVTLGWYKTEWYNTVSAVTGGGGNNDYVRFVSSVSNTAANSGISGVVYIYDPSNTSTGKTIRGDMAGYSNSGTSTGFSIASGTYTSTTAIDSINFLFSSGNIASGVFKLYGIS